MQTTTRIGILLIGSAVVVNLAFTVLGSAFDYPDILQRPADEVLGRFAGQPWLVGGAFALLAAGAAALAPVAILLARRFPVGRLGRAGAAVGIAAAAVQLVGLLRWPLIVPWIANALPGASGAERAALLDAFATLNTVLGQAVGETLGYALTTAWTVLTVLALRRAGVIDRLVAGLGIASAALIATGVLVPVGVPVAEQANFIGYVLWSVWLVVLGVVVIVRGRRPGPAAAARIASPA